MRKILFIAVAGDMSESAPPADVQIGVLCLTDMGNKAAYMKAAPVLPPGQEPEFKEDKLFKWGKIAFEKYLLWKVRNGYKACRDKHGQDR